MKIAFILSLILLTYVPTYGQKNWLVGKWKCEGSLAHLYEFPERTNVFEKEGCRSSWHFKKNGKVICRSTDSDGKPLGRGYSNSKKTFRWELNTTNDTLYMYYGDFKNKFYYIIHKYNEQEFAMVRPDEIRRGYLLIKE